MSTSSTALRHAAAVFISLAETVRADEVCYQHWAGGKCKPHCSFRHILDPLAEKQQAKCSVLCPRFLAGSTCFADVCGQVHTRRCYIISLGKNERTKYVLCVKHAFGGCNFKECGFAHVDYQRIKEESDRSRRLSALKVLQKVKSKYKAEPNAAERADLPHGKDLLDSLVTIVNACPEEWVSFPSIELEFIKKHRTLFSNCSEGGETLHTFLSTHSGVFDLKEDDLGWLARVAKSPKDSAPAHHHPAAPSTTLATTAHVKHEAIVSDSSEKEARHRNRSRDDHDRDKRSRKRSRSRSSSRSASRSRSPSPHSRRHRSSESNSKKSSARSKSPGRKKSRARTPETSLPHASPSPHKDSDSDHQKAGRKRFVRAGEGLVGRTEDKVVPDMSKVKQEKVEMDTWIASKEDDVPIFAKLEPQQSLPIQPTQPEADIMTILSDLEDDNL